MDVNKLRYTTRCKQIEHPTIISSNSYDGNGRQSFLRMEEMLLPCIKRLGEGIKLPMSEYQEEQGGCCN